MYEKTHIDEKTTEESYDEQAKRELMQEVFDKTAKIERLERENKEFVNINNGLYTQNHKLLVQLDELFNRIDSQRDIIESLSIDYATVDKIIKLINEFKDTKTKTHSQVALYTLIWEISDIIDERGD